MKDFAIPTNLNENHIGKVIRVQVLPRTGLDTVDTYRLEKYVGVLEAYSHDHATLTIKLNGLKPINVSRRKQLTEVYVN